MAILLDREGLAYRVVLLRAGGMSKRAIARSLGIGRNRVNRILTKHEVRRKSGHSALPRPPARKARPSKLDPYRGKIDELLHEFPNITAQRIFEELRIAGYDGGVSIARDLVRAIRPKPPPTISLPTPTYGIGEMAENDWSPYVIEFTQAPTRKVHAFCYCLVHSRRKCFSLHESEDFYELLDGHLQAFARLGGLAEKCKYDNQKTVVSHWEGDQPIFNPRFLDFATYYELKPHACRPRRPNDKPKVERTFWEFEKSFLNGRKFADLEDMRARLRWWVDNVCDVRPHKKLRTTALERFAEEKPHLQPLPAHPYDTARLVYRVCDVEGCVSWESNQYEVPYDHVTEIMPVRITASEVYVYAADLSCIAVHPRLEKAARRRARLAGRKIPSSRPRGPTLTQLEPIYQSFDAADFLAGLAETQRSAAYHARKILTLRDQYSTDDLARALAHAAKYQAFDYQSIERILRSRSQPRRLDEYVAERIDEKLDIVLRQSRTEPRALEDYDALPITRSATRPREGEACPPPSPPERSEPEESPTSSEKPSES